MTLRALLTLARRRPNDLLALRDVAFWRGAVPPSLRSTVRAAAERFIARVPEARSLPAFLRWASVKDAQAWVRRIRRPTRAATCAARALVLLEASQAQPAKAEAFIQAADRWFDEIPRRMRALWPGVWAHLAAARGDDELLGCLMEIGHGLMAQDRYAEFFFPLPSLLTPELRTRAQPVVDALSFEGPRRFVRPHDRLQVHMRFGFSRISPAADSTSPACGFPPFPQITLKLTSSPAARVMIPRSARNELAWTNRSGPSAGVMKP